jgi:hypothetical protein
VQAVTPDRDRTKFENPDDTAAVRDRQPVAARSRQPAETGLVLMHVEPINFFGRQLPVFNPKGEV